MVSICPLVETCALLRFVSLEQVIKRPELIYFYCETQPENICLCDCVNVNMLIGLSWITCI